MTSLKSRQSGMHQVQSSNFASWQAKLPSYQHGSQDFRQKQELAPYCSCSFHNISLSELYFVARSRSFQYKYCSCSFIHHLSGHHHSQARRPENDLGTYVTRIFPRHPSFIWIIYGFAAPTTWSCTQPPSVDRLTSLNPQNFLFIVKSCEIWEFLFRFQKVKGIFGQKLPEETQTQLLQCSATPGFFWPFYKKNLGK